MVGIIGISLMEPKSKPLLILWTWLALLNSHDSASIIFGFVLFFVFSSIQLNAYITVMNLFAINRKNTSIWMMSGHWKLAAMTTMLAASRNGCLWKIYVQSARDLPSLIIWATNNLWCLLFTTFSHSCICIYYTYGDYPQNGGNNCKVVKGMLADANPLFLASFLIMWSL